MNKSISRLSGITVIAIILAISIPFTAFSQTILPPSNEVLLASSIKLNSINTIKYIAHRELNYSSENYHSTSFWNIYFDFKSSNSNPTTGFKYQAEDSISKMIFNGTEKFELNKKTNEIKLNQYPAKKDFNSLSFLYNSIVTLKNALPSLINDKTYTKSVTDTIINEKKYFVVDVNVGKRRIQNLGNDFDTMKTKYNLIYKIVIDKVNYLPYQVVQMNNLNKDYIKTTFSEIEINNKNTPDQGSWYYSTY